MTIQPLDLSAGTSLKISEWAETTNLLVTELNRFTNNTDIASSQDVAQNLSDQRTFLVDKIETADNDLSTTIADQRTFLVDKIGVDSVAVAIALG